MATPLVLAAPATADGKVTICHRTHSTTNPYRRISVSISAANGSSQNDHTHHTGAPFDPATTYPPNAKIWGDIIPPIQSRAALNMTGSVLPSPCAASRPGTETMTAQQFYDVELEAGQARDVIVADLSDQGADSDSGITFTDLHYGGTDPTLQASDPGGPTTGGTTGGTTTTSGGTDTSTTGGTTATSGGTTDTSTTGGTTATSGGTTDTTATGGTDTSTTGDTTTTGGTDSPTSGPDPATTVGTEPAVGPTDAAVPTPAPAETPAEAPAEGPVAPEAPAVSAAATGSVVGIVWFDRNDNEAYDGREWTLPGVPVTLTRTGEQQALRRAGVTTTAFAPRTMVTGAHGAYAFTGLPAGTYRVTATAHADGFAYTSDTDGLRDWKVDVAVPANGEAVASFAGLGRGHLTGQVLDVVRGGAVPKADVACRWYGFDDVAGTPDDVVMTDIANSDGRYDWPGVPYGGFSCTGSDPVSGLTSGAAHLSVVSATVVHATLPLGRRTAHASRSVRTALPSASLPRTGFNGLAALTSGLVLLLLGPLLMVLGRRPS